MPDYGQPVAKESTQQSHGAQDSEQYIQTTTAQQRHPDAHAMPRHVKSLAGRILPTRKNNTMT